MPKKLLYVSKIQVFKSCSLWPFLWWFFEDDSPEWCHPEGGSLFHHHIFQVRFFWHSVFRTISISLLSFISPEHLFLPFIPTDQVPSNRTSSIDALFSHVYSLMRPFVAFQCLISQCPVVQSFTNPSLALHGFASEAFATEVYAFAPTCMPLSRFHGMALSASWHAFLHACPCPHLMRGRVSPLAQSVAFPYLLVSTWMAFYVPI